MKRDSKHIQNVFLEAVKIPTAAGREALLDNACADDHELRRRVSELLRAHDLPDNALDTPALDALCITPFHPGSKDYPAYFAPETEHAPGTIIAGRYRLIERLGEGGMGAVYRAEQITP